MSVERLAEPRLWLSPMQQAMLFQSLNAEGLGIFVQQMIGHLPETLDLDLLRACLDEVVGRHDALRSHVDWPADGSEPMLAVAEDCRIAVTSDELASADPEIVQARIAKYLEEDRVRGISLASAPLLRVHVISLPDGTSRLLMTNHHLIMDRVARGVFLRELFGLYDSRRAGIGIELSEAPSFAEHLAWLRQRETTGDEQFWRALLEGMAGPTPLAFPALQRGESRVGSTEIEVSLDAATTARLAGFAADQGVTMATLVHAAWALLLARYSAEQDVVFGAPWAARGTAPTSSREVVGLVMNTLPVRAHVELHKPLLELLRQVRAFHQALRPYQHTSVLNVQAWSGLPPGTPLYESLVNFDSADLDARLQALGPQWSERSFRVREQTGIPLTLYAYAGSRLVLRLSYARARFADNGMSGLLTQLVTALSAMPDHATRPLRELPLLDEAGRKRLLVGWQTATGADHPAGGVHERIAAQAARNPNKVAICAGDGSLSYAELTDRARRLAARLRVEGIGPGSLVGIFVQRTVDMAVAVLGVLESGAAYVPLDPAYPAGRIAFMLEDSGLAAVVTESGLLDRLPGQRPAAVLLNGDEGEFLPPATAASAGEDLAYVIYTSGSTGRPKGVMITHANLCHYVEALPAALGLSSEDRYLHTASLAFSSSVRQLIVPLSLGATVVIAGPTEIADPRRLFDYVRKQRVTVVDLVPTYWDSCLRVLEAMDQAERKQLLDNDVRLALSASEPLPSTTPRRWRELGGATRFINMFGQTETTGIVATYEVSDDQWRDSSIVPIGQPIAHMRMYVLDEQLRPLPPGITGELCIAGAGLGRGYLHQPELTEQRFVPDPFLPGERLHRTGDRARLREDGTIAFAGRSDNQVKVRGFRVEVEEVEAALRRHAAVKDAVVAAHRDRSGETRLVAYLDTPGTAAPSVEALRRFLRAELPDYMVPSHFSLLEELPRTPNGKVDRRNIPEPDFEHAQLDTGFVAPDTATEQILAGFWRDLLGRQRIGIHDSFFELGGHSLMAIRLLARVREAFQHELPLRQLFETPTIAGLAAWIDSRRRAGDQLELPPLGRAPRHAPLRLSHAQERLWILHQMEPTSAAYNLCAAIRLTGSLSVPALERALDSLVQRHESLRTVFPSRDGSPVQVIEPHQPRRLDVMPVSGRTPDEQEDVLGRTLRAEAARPFDLDRGPLFRSLLLRLGNDRHVLLLCMHHIVSDGWSRGVLYDELARSYEAFAQGRSPELEPLPLQYADYAYWQRASAFPAAEQEQLDYWVKQLQGPLPQLELPTDRPRPAIQTFAGATHVFRVPGALRDELQALSAREGVTLYMMLLAAFQTLLGRYAAQDDVIVGSPTAGRTRPELEPLIGFFVNTLVMRGDLSGDPSFRELLARTREAALDAYAHQDVSFDRLVEMLHPERDLSRSPIFQVLFTLQNVPVRPVEFEDLQFTPLDVDIGAAKYDLSLSIVQSQDGLVGQLEYNTDLFDAATVAQLARHYANLLQGVVENPAHRLSTLPMLDADERQRMLVEWNATREDVTEQLCVHELIEAQAGRTPDSPAVSFGAETLSYRELEQRANRRAHELRRLGVGPDVLVGVCLERSAELLVSLLAVWKAGGAYVPLDPTYPRERIALMLEDAAAPVLITDRRILRRLPAADVRALCVDDPADATESESGRAPESGVAPHDLAYVIYTSGSTGHPKGVMVEHRNVVNFFAGMDRRIGGGAPGVWLAVTSISFDISVLELFWTLTRGFHVIIQPEAERVHRAAALAERTTRRMEFGLFYFAASAGRSGSAAYRLLLEGAHFADRHGFNSIWTPERHFHEFGGLYPNPSVTAAALATITQNVQLRAGSVVLPLHDTIRVAEEWAVVDNLSDGRVGIALASGWHDRDFVFKPENYAERRDVMAREIETLRALWRGESVTRTTGAGTETRVAIRPRPVQPELPIWVTAAGGPDTFRRAGEIGANVLTHLLGQSVEELTRKLEIYRQAWRDAGHPGEGRVSLMLHTFVDDDVEHVRSRVWGPFREYLRTSVDLIRNLAQERGQDIRSAQFTADDWDALLDHAFERYFQASALMGTPETCLAMIQKLRSMGVDEIACLIDFGVDEDAVLRSLDKLAELVEEANADVSADTSALLPVHEQILRHGVTHLQCTPSMATLLIGGEVERAALRRLRVLCVGGEALPESLADELTELVPEVHNMYGPTETTIWSSTHCVRRSERPIPIGRPITNTSLYVLDAHQQPVPPGVHGELYIGGAGVVRGYLRRPELTAERFLADPFAAGGARMYRTGDRARFRNDGVLDFFGRLDNQVKLRGHRIELGEVEASLAQHSGIREAVAIVREDQPGDRRLVAYVVPHSGSAITAEELRRLLRERLPEPMIPSHFVILRELPLTPNAKVDRRALPAPEQNGAAGAEAAFVAPASQLEQIIASIWRDVLRLEQVGVRDNFFDLGGHSLLTLKVHARLRDAVQQPITITDLFRFPTIRALSEHLEAGAEARAPTGAETGVQRAEARRQSMTRRFQARQRG
jgi:natural product biosynthesis luciferase-like monooxygenase protein/amino acid adenylation domain-containing protein